MSLYLILALSRTLIVPDEEESGVSGPIRSIKMYSCIQCAMQEKSMCCRDIPCLAHVEQEPDPLHPGHPPPLLSAWPLETYSTSSYQQGWIWTVYWTFANSPTRNQWPLESVRKYCS
jgi:hypothetical protein